MYVTQDFFNSTSIHYHVRNHVFNLQDPMTVTQ